MRGSRRRDNDDGRLPYQKPKPKVAGVRKFKELTYHGWRITLFRRDQGVQTKRIAYSARVTEIRTNVTFYIPPADNQKLVLQAAHRQVDSRRAQAKPEKSKYLTIDRVFNLWFGQDATGSNDSAPFTPPPGASSPQE